ncbi:MAG: hypothetical protein SVZ03_08860 [Spirochaetota bacterium]|nr:hypothetical protein [Spirochaetota bacterium]
MKIKNRRRGPDILIKWINYIAVSCWIFIFTIFIIVSIAKPPVEGFFDRQYGIQVNNTWDRTLLEYAFYLMFPLLIICGIGLLINSTRHKRKTDTYNKTLIVCFVLSILGITYFLFT